MSDAEKLFSRLDALLDRVDRLIPQTTTMETSEQFQAYRWHNSELEGIANFDRVDQSELLHLDRQKNLLTRNTTQFVSDKPANNALLWGARGTGKSSLIKAQLNTFVENVILFLNLLTTDLMAEVFILKLTEKACIQQLLLESKKSNCQFLIRSILEYIF